MKNFTRRSLMKKNNFDQGLTYIIKMKNLFLIFNPIVLTILITLSGCHQANHEKTNNRNKSEPPTDSVSTETVSWVEKYLQKKNRFARMKDVGNETANLKDLYHINPIGHKDYDSVRISIYQIGVNLSHSKEDLLIQREYNSSVSAFQIMDDSISLRNTLKLYNFFEQYSNIPDEIKVICYQKVIIDYNNSFE